MRTKQKKLDLAEGNYGTLCETLPNAKTFLHTSSFINPLLNSVKLPEKKEKRTRFPARHEKKIQISVTITPSLLQKFENRVAEVGQTRAAVLSHLIAKWLKV